MSDGSRTHYQQVHSLPANRLRTPTTRRIHPHHGLVPISPGLDLGKGNYDWTFKNNPCALSSFVIGIHPDPTGDAHTRRRKPLFAAGSHERVGCPRQHDRDERL